MKLGAVVVLAVVGVGCAVLVSAVGNHGSTAAVSRPTAGASAAPFEQATIFVHILGAVKQPGLYELSQGDRAVDAVAAAGGFTDKADDAQLNLARLLVDGEQIYVPERGEMPAAAPGMGAQGKVNINTADAATLDTLPRVGPAMAARILDWREANGRFATIDDLKGVSGIGDKTFDGLKDLITV
ncbi:MAG: ComEA family DNA-binding protein [Salinibacterium sp.]|nr:MAG: ComEA family DNA-binding protein [Salinibacterium sp.]